MSQASSGRQFGVFGGSVLPIASFISLNRPEEFFLARNPGLIHEAQKTYRERESPLVVELPILEL